ncbi:MAG TPA: hypothetical protein VMS37_31285 [Verrucomicrobiae bacterium]|nr:hypothetical protein [Verrucomicrobiae bacterium]
MKKYRIHAVAVSLLGWYLMLPPATGQNGIPQLVINAPIAHWTVAQSFDSSKECEKELDLRRTKFEKIYKKSNHDNVGEEFWSGLYLAAADSAECVATDDPRLREGGSQDAAASPEKQTPPEKKPAADADSQL